MISCPYISFCISVIARHRIKHPTDEIKTFVDSCDLVELPPEHAELLLKFVPTKEEVSCIEVFTLKGRGYNVDICCMSHVFSFSWQVCHDMLVSLAGCLRQINLCLK